MSQKNKIPFKCRLGFHSWYLDAALVSAVSRCHYCPKVDSETAARMVEEERQKLEELSKEPDFSMEKAIRVLRGMHGP